MTPGRGAVPIGWISRKETMEKNWTSDRSTRRSLLCDHHLTRQIVHDRAQSRDFSESRYPTINDSTIMAAD
jgi:hypothetical protein